MSTTKKLFASAEAAWPEDEASLTFDSHKAATESEDAAYAVTVSRKNVAHMHKVFGSEADGAELICRYDAELRHLGMPSEVFPVAQPPASAAHTPGPWSVYECTDGTTNICGNRD